MQTHANSRRLFHLLAPLLLLILLTLSQIGSVKSAYAATASTVSAHHTLSPAVGPPDAT